MTNFQVKNQLLINDSPLIKSTCLHQGWWTTPLIPELQEIDAEGSRWVQGYSGLQSEFQNPQSYPEKLCLKKEENMCAVDCSAVDCYCWANSRVILCERSQQMKSMPWFYMWCFNDISLLVETHQWLFDIERDMEMGHQIVMRELGCNIIWWQFG